MRYLTFALLAVLLPALLQAQGVSDTTETNAAALVATQPESALSVNEPMFFIVGSEDDTTAQFQLSFKYRVFAEDGFVVSHANWLENFHIAYTQTSLWNLSENSAPFEDTTYRPSFFWEFGPDSAPLGTQFLRTGYEHASNGQDEDRSRSIDTIFLMPAWRGSVFGEDWVVAPKLVGYLSKGEENKDIEKFRGRSDLIVRVGNEESLLVSSLLRLGDRGRTTLQLDFSYPIRKRIFSRTGGYVFLRAFKGYGETLETYNQKQDLQIRIGFAIVR